ncbi:hypothetical protein F4780DRAFT_768812 [Xylariomycetidae sp. FL0641]|nr:hypothetical protein F4780DRAFT_768812 [Xylariomycetidae sp. FL0641]
MSQPATQMNRTSSAQTKQKPFGQSAGGRPPLTHQTQSWSTTSRPGRTAPTTSAPSTTTRDTANVNKPARNETTSTRNKSRLDPARAGSSSSIPRFHASTSDVTLTDRSITESPVEIRVAHQIEVVRPPAQATRIYPELDRYRDLPVPVLSDDLGRNALYKLATEDLPPPTPQFSGASSHSQPSNFSASPSTRFSESPGPGPYSRDTTPTSMSSQSPGLMAPMRWVAARTRQVSPATGRRPPVTRRRAGSASNDGDVFGADTHGLASVREALTSSSSNSTVRNEEKKEKKGRRGRSPTPPNPPPRKSSEKFMKDQKSEEATSPKKEARGSSKPVVRSPSPSKLKKAPRDKDVASSPQPRLKPPSRPSRDGTPDLFSQLGGPVPVIQSNLSSTSLTERRQSSQLSSSTLPRSATPSSGHNRSASSNPTINREPTPAPRSAIPAPSQGSKPEHGRTTRTPSPGVSTFKSRFPLFGRRTKTDTDVSRTDKKEKPARKGPAAGTGHEGYGKFGAVKRRSSSNASNLQRAAPSSGPSSDSLASSQSADPFLLDRMRPVIIAGGEVIENRNASCDLARTESNQSTAALGRPGMASRDGSSVSLSSKEEARQTLWPSAFPRPSTHSRNPSDSSGSEAVTMKSTLAFRRSVRGMQPTDNSPFTMPRPIKTRAPSAASMATTILTDDSMLEPEPEPAPEPVAEPPTQSNGPKKLVKRAKSPRKWNLFGRSQTSLALKKPAEANAPEAAKPPQTKPVAFYTMMDSSEQEESSEQEVSAVPKRAEAKAKHGVPAIGPHRRPSADERPSQATEAKAKHVVPAMGQHRRPSADGRPSQATMGAPVPRQAPAASGQRIVDPPLAPRQPGSGDGRPQATGRTTPQTSGRPSRLPQVGRIPKVVNTRPRQASPQSFSRPFNRVSMQLGLPEIGPLDQASVAKGPSPPKSSTPEPTFAEPSRPDDGQQSTQGTEFADQDSCCSEMFRPGKEFLSFSPRKNSECATSTTSSCSMIVGYSNHTAVPPELTAPLGEDEVWDEYNDLLGDVPPSPGSSCGVPFHLEEYEMKLAERALQPLLSPTIKTDAAANNATRNLRASGATGNTTTSSSHYSGDMTARINAAFGFAPNPPPTSNPPPTPFSVTDFVSGYEARNAATSMRDSSSSQPSAKARNSGQRSSGSSRLSEDTPLSQVNLRVGSMTVSKWLTFGHVLFSPVRDELVNAVDSLQRQSILVIDGLGNDDWSFYAAETYPAATFYNLSPRAPISQEHKSTLSFPHSPPNHHQIQFNSHAGRFPFGSDSFTAVVFRFPSVAPEAHYRNIISEARRVLKPGGYMELSILDVDLNNMGNRTRRAVRRLKERVHTQHPTFHLSSTSDIILRLLGKKGFTEIKSCRVGVPVANAVMNSQGSKGKKDERSLAEMMNDESEVGDESITKMMSKVGRWWYNRCYELPTGMNKSIWNDRSLLAECNEWNTSLKLMVCHARMPEAGCRVKSI